MVGIGPGGGATWSVGGRISGIGPGGGPGLGSTFDFSFIGCRLDGGTMIGIGPGSPRLSVGGRISGIGPGGGPGLGSPFNAFLTATGGFLTGALGLSALAAIGTAGSGPGTIGTGLRSDVPARDEDGSGVKTAGSGPGTICTGFLSDAGVLALGAVVAGTIGRFEEGFAGGLRNGARGLSKPGVASQLGRPNTLPPGAGGPALSRPTVPKPTLPPSDDPGAESF